MAIKWTEIIEIKCDQMNNEIKFNQIIVIIGKSMNKPIFMIIFIDVYESIFETIASTVFAVQFYF